MYIDSPPDNNESPLYEFQLQQFGMSSLVFCYSTKLADLTDITIGQFSNSLANCLRSVKVKELWSQEEAMNLFDGVWWQIATNLIKRNDEIC